MHLCFPNVQTYKEMYINAYTYTYLVWTKVPVEFEVCLRMAIKTPKRSHWRLSGVFLSTLSMISTFFWCFWLFFTVNITNFNNHLIYIMKLQESMVLWSVLKSPLVLCSSFAATSQFICIANWLVKFCMVRIFRWLKFSNRF